MSSGDGESSDDDDDDDDDETNKGSRCRLGTENERRKREGGVLYQSELHSARERKSIKTV